MVVFVEIVVASAFVASAIRAGAGLVVVGEQDASGTFSFSYGWPHF